LPTSIRQDVPREDLGNRKRSFGHKIEHQESDGHGNSMLKYQKVGEQGSVAVRRPTQTFWTDQRVNNQNEDVNFSCTVRERSKFVEPYGSYTTCAQHFSSSGNQQPAFELSNLEESWYISPEELSQFKGTFPSNIYSLGVLLFEVRLYYFCVISAVVPMLDSVEVKRYCATAVWWLLAGNN